MSEVILGIDTSTRVSVGVARDGLPLASHLAGDSRSHAELLVPTIQSVLAAGHVGLADLTGVAVGMGPGPYTGLRVGIAAAEMIAEVAGVAVWRHCSLDVLGIGWARTVVEGDFVACTDARRRELYWAVYDSSGRRIDGPFVSGPGELPALPVVGPGSLLYPVPGVVAPGGAELVVDGGWLAAYAGRLEDVGAEPLYLRHADAVPSAGPKPVLVGRESR